MRRKKYLLIIIVAIFYIYYSQWYWDINESFFEVSTCPACYGLHICEVALSSTPLSLKGLSSWKIYSLVNVKNVFYGTLGNNDIVLKKLAHTHELKKFDDAICKATQVDYCNISINIQDISKEKNLERMIKEYPHLFSDGDFMRCGYTEAHENIIRSYIKWDGTKYAFYHILTLLAINPEPFILVAFQNDGLPLPKFSGSCGRAFIEEFVGPTLADLRDDPWHTRCYYAAQLLELAFAFTDHYVRLYMTDVASHNFAVDRLGKVKLIDAENIIVFDPTLNGLINEEHFNDGHGCSDCFSFSEEELCRYTSADHNFFAICKGLLSEQAFDLELPRGLLHSPPKDVHIKHPQLFKYTEECAFPSFFNSRRQAAEKLLQYLKAVYR